ncbi:MAG TPA: TMEM175 family protein, partial [Candidatus Binatia bacterium]|nr:TMEM175 family protein [Candidatus Binatia bacterium]
MSEAQPVFKPRPRIQTLSDLIFGLALSIGALALIGQQHATFEAIVTSLFFYSFSFLVLVSVWRSYSIILSVLPVETELLTNLNILLLFIVSIEPYLFNQLFIARGTLWNNV